MNSHGTLIVGIGSPHGDDQLGWHVADRLDSLVDQSHVDVRRAKSPMNLLDWLEPLGRLVICDACHGSGPAAEVRRWRWPAPELAEVALSGTHTLSLPAVLALAETLGRLPRDVVIWTIEGVPGRVGHSMTSSVANAIPVAVNRIVFELNHAERSETQSCTNGPW